ncbi:MAG: hypothetical protein Q7S53_00340 [bacterium]|nr:hypothetical protein [bacterium]
MDPEEENEEIEPEEMEQGEGGGSSLGSYDDSHRSGKSLEDYGKGSKGTDTGSSSGENTGSNTDKKGDGSDKKGSGKGDKGAGEKTGAAAGDKGSSATKDRANALRNKGRQLKGAAQDPKGTAENFLKQQIKKRIIWLVGGWVGGSTVLLIIGFIFIGFLIIALIQGSQQETMTTGYCNSITGDLSCFANKAKSPTLDPCYYDALRKAEKETETPWQVIAAVDFKVWNQGAADERGLTNEQALIQLGWEIQKANYRRDPITGDIWYGTDGKPDQGISVKKSYSDPQDFLNVAVILRHYECMYLTDGKYTGENLQNLLGCYKCETNDQLSEVLKDPWISKNSLVPSMAITGTANWKNTGALSFYNYLMQNCEAIGMKSGKGGGGGGGGTGGGGMGGIGTPGQRDPNNIPVLNNWKQGNWCGGAPWWNDPTWWGCNMQDCGCGLTSAAIVAAWYGCSIDPGSLNAAVGTSGNEGAVWDTAASTCGLSYQQQPGAQAVRDFLTSTHEPMVVGVSGNICGTYSGGHFVAVAGFDGSNYYVYDPGCCGDVYIVSQGEFEGMMGGTNISFYK